MLAREFKRRRPRRVLDVGTGTGVLAMASAKAARRRVVAGDLDPEAVRVARQNARLNRVAGLVTFYAGPGIRHPAARARRFDLVTANILARPLIRLAPELARALARNGTMILSGLLLRDAPGVLAAYAAQGLRLEARLLLEGWATLHMKKGGVAPRPVRTRKDGNPPRPARS
jgi:ribosomal protein L11 methyltransferase